MSARRLDATALRDWAHTAVGDLIAHTDEINRLNVFPVADADTGTNMLFTMRSAWAQADAQSDATTSPQVAAALAAGRPARRARQLRRDPVADPARAGRRRHRRPPQTRGGALPDIDGPVFAAALRHAVGLVVASMGEPVPGTIVSVLQAAAGAAEHAGADGADLAEVVAAAADAAAVALDKTTEQLDVLAEAGVVDAGGRGLLVLLDAMTTALTGRAPHRHAVSAVARRTPTTAATTIAAPQFEVMYLLSGCDAGRVETLARAARPARRIRGHRRVGGWRRPLLGARPRRRCRRRRRGGLAVRHAEPHPDHRAVGRRRGRGRRAGGAASGRCWRSSTATAPRNCSPARVRTWCGPKATRR